MDMCQNVFKNFVAHATTYATWAKISLGGTSRNHFTKITRKLGPIFKMKFHLFIY